MKKIITAIGNNFLNEHLAELKKYEIIGKDIPYKEGILEVLTEKQDVDILIISELLEGNINFKDLILDVLKINRTIDIIVFVDNEDKELKNFLYERGIYKIYKNNQIDIQELDNVLELENSKSTKELTEEIKKLKQIIEVQKLQTDENIKLGKITAITGSYGSRKKYFSLYTL